MTSAYQRNIVTAAGRGRKAWRIGLRATTRRRKAAYRGGGGGIARGSISDSARRKAARGNAPYNAA